MQAGFVAAGFTPAILFLIFGCDFWICFTCEFRFSSSRDKMKGNGWRP
jgi:hypothetical protein